MYMYCTVLYITRTCKEIHVYMCNNKSANSTCVDTAPHE